MTVLTEAASAIGATSFNYVAIADGSIWEKEDLWRHIQTALTEERAVRQPRPRLGRPPKGPASGTWLGDSPSERARKIGEAYWYLTDTLGRPAQYIEVARRLLISGTTIWRWRQANDWPPERPEAGSL